MDEKKITDFIIFKLFTHFTKTELECWPIAKYVTIYYLYIIVNTSVKCYFTVRHIHEDIN